MSRTLYGYEQEATINFNKAEDTAHILTYEKTWQKHLEGKPGLKPVVDNGFGGKEYELPRSRIGPPKAPRKLFDSAERKLTERLHGNRALSAQNLVPVGKFDTESRNKGRSIFPAKQGQGYKGLMLTSLFLSRGLPLLTRAKVMFGGWQTI